MKTIYDVGANIGDNLPYYLKKADRVIAIEAHQGLADLMRAHFRDYIADGRLVIENCVVLAGEGTPSVQFYYSREAHQLCQFNRPAEADIARFEEVTLPARSLMSIVDQHGSPHYMKIDIEHYDQMLLKELFSHGVFPPYISAESHSIEVFAALVALGGYDAFKLVDGESVPLLFGDCIVDTADGPAHVQFLPHSAGPFGNDIPGPWHSANTFFHTLAQAGLGWKDIHASRVDASED